MVTIHAGGESYSVLFDVSDINRLDKRGIESVVQTKCGIFKLSTMRPVAVGYAHLNPADNEFDVKGCEVSLGRALQQLTKDKEVRALFWDAFWRAANAKAVTGDDIIDVPSSLPRYANGEVIDESLWPTWFVTRRTADEEAELQTLQKDLAEVTAAAADVPANWPAHNTQRCDICNKWRARIAELEQLAPALPGGLAAA